MMTDKEIADWMGEKPRRDPAVTFLIVMAFLFSLAIVWGAYSVGDSYRCEAGAVQVESGDTVWSIIGQITALEIA